MDFDIEITENQIKFTNLQNKKSLHTESFKILTFNDFYKELQKFQGKKY